ncbi:MAG: ubiquitin-like domain-containing protein [Chloroflexia bacterium]
MRTWPWGLLCTLAGLALLFAAASWGYQASAQSATIVVDGEVLSLRTHQRLVGGVLHQAGLSLHPADEVYPPPEAPWQPDQPIVVRRAFPVTVRVDGREVHFYGRPRSILEALALAGVALRAGDAVYANARLLPESAYADGTALRLLLPRPETSPHLAAPTASRPSLLLEVVRAIPLHIHDDGVDLEIHATAATVGQALEEAGIPLYWADRVYPDLDAPATAGLHIYLTRSFPVTLTADGRTYTTRTQAQTVGELLRQEGLSLLPEDRVEPPPEAPLRPGMAVRVIRVTTYDQVTESPIPFRYLQQPDPDLELDQHRLRPGQEGLKQEIVRITYEDGHEVRRTFLGEQVVREPVDQIFYYGTRIVIRTLETPDGPIQYWRKIRVWATSYYPRTCDKSPDDPTYGITYTGKRATRGIVAVDPRVIPLHTRMYVPGYGFGAAEDIGGAIKGRHIDLCFDDADWGKGLWETHYVDIYLLLPIPEKFPWILP